MTAAEDRERERWEAMDAAFGAWRQGCVRRRHHAGLSRAAVARAAGIDGTTMARVENLDGSPRYWPESRTIVKVSWALGWTLDELVDVFADDGEGLFARILKMEGPGGRTGYEALAERYANPLPEPIRLHACGLFHRPSEDCPTVPDERGVPVEGLEPSRRVDTGT